ncbi:hypothetical protein ebrios_3 [Escherichia phage Ebrios]|uniref:Uncharacterized protein n=1 Tax=Escherichia phage Ebrios TaxID=2099356 RepID=A0A2P1CKW4_9CAUD|nr:ocr-like anti-restriction [Escherichia phage Ebrios]AVJ51886.1 hypothetical protein ebrios_3 [Escherichia phage Ebrios]
MKRNANAYYELLAAAVEAFNVRIQEDQLTEHHDYHAALHEVVDKMVPHCYWEIFMVMAADGIDVEFDDAGQMPDTKDVTRILQARIYEALYNDVPSDSGIEWYEGEEEEESEEPCEWYVINDEESGPYVVAYYDSLEAAIEAANERYNTLGKRCHVEDDVSSEVLYKPVPTANE